MNLNGSTSDCARNAANCDDESLSEPIHRDSEEADDDILSFRTLDSFKLHNKMTADNPSKRLPSFQGMEVHIPDNFALSWHSTTTSHGGSDDDGSDSSLSASDGSFSLVNHNEWAFTASTTTPASSSKLNNYSAAEMTQSRTLLNQYPFESTANPIFPSPNRQVAPSRFSGGALGRISPRKTSRFKNSMPDKDATKSMFDDNIPNTKMKCTQSRSEKASKASDSSKYS